MKTLRLILTALITIGLVQIASPSYSDPSCTITISENAQTASGTSSSDVICITGNDNTVNALGGNDIVIDDGDNNTVNLGSGDDSIDASGGDGATIDGGEGDDQITGTPTDDGILGGNGDDEILGGNGDDVITGNDGADTINGGSGNDNLSGNVGNDSITGAAGDDTIDGGSSNDNLNGGDGIDLIIGAAGDDTIDGGSGNDNLAGDAGQDAIFGSSGQDSISGGLDNDALIGGSETDSLNGGAGLNKCDYSDSEPRTTTCVYDDAAPLLSSLTISADSWDTSTNSINAHIDLSVTDDIGLSYVRLLCKAPVTNSVTYTAFDIRYSPSGVTDYSVSSNLTSSIISGNALNSIYSVDSTIRQGMFPGVYTCSIEMIDQMNHSRTVSQTGFTLTRSGSGFDDDAPIIVVDALTPNPVDVGASDQYIDIDIRATDANSPDTGQLQCSKYENGSWYEPINLAWWTPLLVDYPNGGRFTATSVSATEVRYQVRVKIRKNMRAGDYRCGGATSDSLGNWTIRSNIFTLSIVNTSDDIDNAGPTVSNVTFTPSAIDVGAQNQTVNLKWTVSDATAWNWGYLACTSTTASPQQKILDAVLDKTSMGDYGGRQLTKSISGTAQEMSYDVNLVVPFGAYPDTYRCVASFSDTINNWSQTTIGDITVLRTPAGQPSQPQNLAFTPDESRPERGALTWDPPSSLGAPGLVDYQIDYSLNGETWITLADGLSTATQVNFSNLKTSTFYWFRVRADNGGNTVTGSAGATWSSTLATTTPDPLPPLAPQSTSQSNVTSYSTMLSWVAPTYNGGSVISNYIFETKREGTDEWVEIPHAVSTSTSISLTGLAPGTTYAYRVSAVNISGAGDSIESSFTTSSVSASAPRNLAVTNVAATSASLAWDLPETNGGSDITDYKVEVSLSGSEIWSEISHTASAQRTFGLSNLQKGKTYLVRISPVTNFGYGTTTDSISLTTETTTPASVTNLNASNITSSSASITWTAPIDNGGTPITDYQILTSRDAGNSWQPVNHSPFVTRSFNLSGLSPNTNYLVKIAAVNIVGNSAPIQVAVTTLPNLASSPQSLRATSTTNTSTTLLWDLPATNGGTGITNYVIEVSKDGNTFTRIARNPSAIRSAVISNLKPKQTYWLKVTAVTDIGEGISSDAINVSTTGFVPTAPTSLSVNSGKIYAQVSWKAATTDTSTPVTNYIVTISKDGGKTWLNFNKAVSKSRTLKITGLKSKKTYYVRVRAVNLVGTSGNSRILKIVTK